MSGPARTRARRWAFRGLLLASLAGAVLAYGGPLVFELRGQTLLVLTGGSMAPTYPAGSVVVAEQVTPDQLKVGQVITFKESLESHTYVTHEIIALKTLPRTEDDGSPVYGPSGRIETDHYVQTKGQNNEDPDPNLTPVGQVRYLVVDGYAGWGAWLLWSRTFVGKLVLFAPPFLLLLMAELWSWRTATAPAPPDEPQQRRPGQRHEDVAHAVV
jgi:signal peptidase I